MAINLTKGQSITLEKEKYDLNTVTMGLGWDVVPDKGSGGGGLLKNLFSSAPLDFDLDGFALMLGANDKVLSASDVIYYGNLKLADGTVYHSGDNLTGEGEGDDEQIVIKLKKLGIHYQKIVLAVNIYKAQERNQHFGLVQNAFVRAVDASGEEMIRYSLSQSSDYDGESSMLLGELYRRGPNWKFRAIGRPTGVSSIQEVVKQFS